MQGCRPFTAEETRRILAELNRGRYPLRDRALFVLGVTSGFRISELLSLTIADVWVDGQLLDIIRVRRSHMKRKKQGRTVATNPIAAGHLKRWIAELMNRHGAGPADVIFRSQVAGPDGKPRAMSRKRAWEILKAAAHRAGAYGAIGTHSMRKTFANKFHAMSGRDLSRTQDALGHTDIRATKKYMSFDQADTDNTVRRMRL